MRRLKKALEAQVELGHQAEAPPASLDKGQGDAEEKGEGKAGEEKADVVGGMCLRTYVRKCSCVIACVVVLSS